VLQSCQHGFGRRPDILQECETHGHVCSKWRHFEPAVITCAIGWYLGFSLAYRNVEELLTERGLPADLTTIWRWVQCYAPELNKRCCRELKPTKRSSREGEVASDTELRRKSGQ
jgi:transposase-like protein